APGRWKIGRTANVEPLLGGLDDVVGWGIALALSATVLSFLAAWKISRHFSGSVEALAEGVRKVGRGELDASVRVDGEDELGALARGFNRMILDLKSAVHVREERVRLEERDRLRSELLANVSHDLRTPLTAVQWSVENLQAGVAGEMNEVQKTYLQGIEKSAGHLLLLIDDLISFSRLDAGRLKLETSPLELAFVAREAVRLLSPLIEKKRLAVAVEGEARLEGDGDRLRQVFSNLIDNAIKFSPEGGRIEVAIREEGDVALALVRDQGPGIEPSLREAVFERFRSERGKGVGIGLNLARSLVRLHGGDLTAEDAPGGGACFRVELPKGGPHGKRMRADC
ncbi:MAG: ATP-binding protein, partial [Planctomycetota bacterium]